MKTMRTRVGILAIALALGGQAFGQTFLTNGLIAYYQFGGNTSDSLGNGSNGVVSRAVVTTNRFGEPGSAYFFDGTDSSIVCAIPNLPAGAAPRTVTLWENTLPVNSEWANLFFWGAAAVDAGFGLIYDGVARKTFTAQGWSDDVVSTVTADTKWHQVAVIYDGRILSVAIDGVLQAAATKALNTAFSQLYVGAGLPGDGPKWFHGGISDLRVYNRSLSTNELSLLYLYESQNEPCVPHGAAATSILVNGFVVGVNVTDPGCGYSNAPAVVIEGGGGAGAAGVASLTNGMVTGITITNPGLGYTNPPTVYIYAGPLGITAQPQSTNVYAYGTASFGVAVSSNATLPVTYQWSFNGTNILGATSTSLVVSNVTPVNLGTYAVAVTDPFESVVSSNAVLSMYPFLLSPFTGGTTDWGLNPELTVQAWGTGPLSYQWYFEGAPISGATNQMISFSGIQFTNGGFYSVVVSSPLGSVTNAPEQLVVNPAGVSLGLYPGVTITGAIGYSYLIQATTDLSNTNSWQTLTNLTLQQSVQLWVDTAADASLPANPRRFYRVLPAQ